MYPFEMHFDHNGIGYVDIGDSSFPIFTKQFSELDYGTSERLILKKDFFLLPSTNDYILKVNKNINVNDPDNYLMIRDLIRFQSEFTDVDFPVGYVKNGLNIVGQIIRYYPDSISLKKICIVEDLSGLQKYIYLSDDSLHNLFLVYLEILKKLEYLYESGISYYDCHAGNWIIANNELKLIDFDSGLISFSKIKFDEICILCNYLDLIKRVSSQFSLPMTIDFNDEYSFSNAKRKILDFENNIRKIRP